MKRDEATEARQFLSKYPNGYKPFFRRPHVSRRQFE